MEYSPWDPNLTRKTWIDRVQAVLEILLVSGLFSSILAALPFSMAQGKNADITKNATFTAIFLLIESGITFILLAMILKLHHERIRNLGLIWDRWRPNILMGLILVPFLFAINALVAFIFREYFPQFYSEMNPLTENIHTPRQLALFILSALIAGGIKEELQRAFILTRFQKYLGGAGLGLVLWSLAFGMGHYIQGVQGITVTAMCGFLFGLIYLISGSLIAPIVAHSLYDTLALLSYWYLSDHVR
jgi:membrane protease YdiL (CAAX protease family)